MVSIERSRSMKKKKKNKKINYVEAPKVYPFTQWSVCGAEIFGYVKNDPMVEFVNKETNEWKIIIDWDRNIVNFPGIEDIEDIEPYIGEGSLYPQIAFGASFHECENGNYMMLWKVQPEGRFWEDETGFGRNSDDEIILYAYLNHEGDFTGPFRIYSIGLQKYFNEKR